MRCAWNCRPRQQQLTADLRKHRGQIIPGSRLRHHQLWDLHQDPVSNVVAAQVRLLRRKLAAHGLPSPIETVPSKGYRLAPPATADVSHHRSSTPRLLWRARLRLAGLSLLVMGTLLDAAGFAMGRLLMQTQETAIRRELQSLAGTLHDSLKPACRWKPGPPAPWLRVLPGLCLAGKPCIPPTDLIHRHAISASDPDRYKLRVFNHHGVLIANSPAPCR